MSQKIKSFTIINDADGNDSFTVEGRDAKEAMVRALEELGWWVAEGDTMDTDNNDNCVYCGQRCWRGDMCDEQQAGGFNKDEKAE